MKKHQIGIEIGSKHLRICLEGKKKPIRLVNAIALDDRMNIVASGNEAFSIYEREPKSVQIIMPMTGGVIGDYTNMRLLLSMVLKRQLNKMHHYNCLVAVPADITSVEKKAFYDLVAEAGRGLKDIRLLPKPMADAVGLGMNPGAPLGNMIINMGAATTEISVISLGGIVKSRLVQYGGNEIDRWVIHRLKEKYNIDVGMRSAENLKVQYSRRKEEDTSVAMKGRNVISGLPERALVPVDIVGEKVKEYTKNIVNEAKGILEVIPPELSADIMVEGIYLSGGGSSFGMISQWMEESMGIPVHQGSSPEESVLRGLEDIMKKDYKLYK